jgi:carboxyl-terminal processing protease
MNNTDGAHMKKGLRMLGSIACLVAVFFVGVYTGYQNRPAMQKITGLVHKESPIESGTDFNAFWKAWQTVDEKLPGAEDISNQDKVYGAIKGLLASYKDPYTTFFTPEENKIFESEIAGEFSGIGIEIGQKNDILTVIAPLKDTPADRAGIKAGDKIIKIGDAFTSDIGIDGAISLIRGEEGTPVTLTIIREEDPEPKIFTIKRAKITLPTIDTETRDEEKIFVIHLYNFSAHSVEDFRKAFDQYLASGYPNLVLDMRGNPGGYLEAAVTIAGWLIPEGKVVVKEIGKTPKDVRVHTSKGPTEFPSTHKMIVLVDQGSASAAEILAGALSEQGVATLAGEKTFGKGSVQEIIKLTKDTSLKVTVAKWYTPQGISISDSGLTPKVVIPYKADVNGKDLQLEEAFKLFK